MTETLRSEIVALLEGRDAHMGIRDALAGASLETLNARPPHVPYSLWHLLEHIRLAQADILSYVRDGDAYVELPWPDGYWPARDALADRAAVDATVAAIERDRDALAVMVADPTVDLTAILPGTPGHTLMREVRIVADHAAYHLGELAILRRVLGDPPD